MKVIDEWTSGELEVTLAEGDFGDSKMFLRGSTVPVDPGTRAYLLHERFKQVLAERDALRREIRDRTIPPECTLGYQILGFKHGDPPASPSGSEPEQTEPSSPSEALPGRTPPAPE